MKGRTYRFSGDEPLYRFGYGLSYTTFKYSKLKIRGFDVSVDVMNNGKLAGDEVVQLYIRDMESSVPVPRLHLEGFRRIHLKPGENRTIELTLNREQFASMTMTGNLHRAGCF